MMHVGIPRVHQGCSVHWGDTMSTARDIMSTLGDIMMHVGDTKCTLGDVQYIGGYHEYSADIMSTSGGYHDACGEKVDKILSISIENPDVLIIP